jgi:hypothetical protein
MQLKTCFESGRGEHSVDSFGESNLLVLLYGVTLCIALMIMLIETRLVMHIVIGVVSASERRPCCVS